MTQELADLADRMAYLEPFRSPQFAQFKTAALYSFW
jgi:hypothetical protein